MPASVPLRRDFDARHLRKLASRCKDARQSRRLLSLAAVYDGMSRGEAARIGGMDRQTLRDWVHRFNEEGPDGLTNRKGAGRTRYLSDVQMKELGEIVETGPERGCPLAADRPEAGDRGALWRHLFRARDIQTAWRTGLCPYQTSRVFTMIKALAIDAIETGEEGGGSQTRQFRHGSQCGSNIPGAPATTRLQIFSEVIAIAEVSASAC